MGVLSTHMEKDFDRWNEKKKETDKKPTDVKFHQREVWWCSIGVNVGSEVIGKGKQFARPILIFRTFTKNLLWGIPLTTRRKSGSYFYKIKRDIDGTKRWALLNQLRLFDSKRLIRKIGMISKKDFFETKKAVEELLPQQL